MSAIRLFLMGLPSFFSMLKTRCNSVTECIKQYLEGKAEVIRSNQEGGWTLDGGGEEVGTCGPWSPIISSG